MKGELSNEDARAIVRLLGEVCSLPGDHSEKKRCLMEGLCDLVGADYWAWVMAAELEPGKFPVYTGFLSGRFSDGEMAEFLQIQAHPEMMKWTGPFVKELRATGRHLTRNVHEMFSYSDFLASEVGQWWCRAGFEPRCIAFRPLENGGTTGIGVYRKTGRPFFTEREGKIAHILLSEVPWLHEMGWPEDRHAKIPELTRRCWLVHEMLLQGYSRPKIAGHLGISIHTINDYTKQIYRHLGLHSQVELITRFRKGDGGDNRSS